MQRMQTGSAFLREVMPVCAVPGYALQHAFGSDAGFSWIEPYAAAVWLIQCGKISVRIRAQLGAHAGDKSLRERICHQ